MNRGEERTEEESEERRERGEERGERSGEEERGEERRREGGRREDDGELYLLLNSPWLELDCVLTDPVRTRLSSNRPRLRPKRPR